MPKQNTDSKKASSISPVDLPVLPVITLLLVLLLGIAALNQTMPNGADRAPSGVKRVGRYLRTGQWQADVRTVAAAFRYFVDPELGPEPGEVTLPTGGVAIVRSNTSPNLPNI
jgi:hypothetical protein